MKPTEQIDKGISYFLLLFLVFILILFSKYVGIYQVTAQSLCIGHIQTKKNFLEVNVFGNSNY